jgi:hypothetical protein
MLRRGVRASLACAPVSRRGAGARAATLVVLVLASASVLHGPVRADDAAPLVPQPLLDRVARAVQDLAKKGRRAETDELLSVLAELRAPAKDVDAQRAAASKALAKAKEAPLPLPDAARGIAKLAADLAAQIAAQPDGCREALARQVLRLDAGVRAAHAALGDEERDGRFVPKAMVPCLARRAEIQDALTRARRLEVPLDSSESTFDLFEEVVGRKGVCVSHGDIAVHSAELSAAQLEREFRHVLRAAALGNWLRTGTLEVPKMARRLDMLFVSSGDAYAKSVALARGRGHITETVAAAARGWDGFVATDYRVFATRGESSVRVHGFFHVCEREDQTHEGEAQTALYAGQVNWLYAAFVGVPMPGIGEVDKVPGASGDRGGTHDTPAVTTQDTEIVRLARAGIHGSRRYMRWLVHRGEDPAWSQSMVDTFDKLGAKGLLKCTLVVDHLHETGEFAKLLEETRGKPSAAATFEPLLEGGLGAFEARWREWLLADERPSGLVQRLGAALEEPLLPQEAAVLRHLDAIRRATLGATTPGLGVDRELSDGCRAHALYLLRHPEQQAAWPAAHEEYPGEDGFTPAGSRAGLSSVVHPGATGPENAVDSWMGTFYHRIPLLEAGLVRIGWGMEKNVAVLDVLSLVGQAETVGHCVWPAAGATGVPRRFSPELPNPVPGEDQSAWGYPVTLQFRELVDDPDVSMKLFVGARRGGPEVPCHYSTPKRPTNPQCAPQWAYCLIPKQTLAASASYTVVATGMPKGAEFVWTFTTGSK